MSTSSIVFMALCLIALVLQQAEIADAVETDGKYTLCIYRCY